MAKILSHTECKSKNNCDNCPHTSHPEGCEKGDCRTCPTHCPCCSGCDDGFCNQCPEEDCSNRTAPYGPNSVSQKEE